MGYYYHLRIALHDPADPVCQSAIRDGLVPAARPLVLPANASDLFDHPIQGHAQPPPTPPTTAPPHPPPPPPPSDPPRRQHLDARFSIITLERIDMASHLPSAAHSRSRGKSVSFTDSPESYPSGTKARYVPLVSSSADIGYGIVHLYREKADTPGLFSSPSSSSARRPDVPTDGDGDDNGEDSHNNASNTNGGEEEEGNSLGLPESQSSAIVAILAVPAYMTPSDFLGFVGEECRDAVSHFRLIRTGDDLRKYMVLMKFREFADAQAFANRYNGRVFNTMEPETCHVVFVKSVRFQVPELDPTQSVLATPVSQGEPSPIPLMQLSPDDAKVVVGHGPLTTKPVAPPTGPLLELPTCPVCLERMDETTGLLTTQCQHVFHCACLSKWKDGSCPVCRFTSNERSNLPGTRNPLRKWKLGGLDDSSEADPDICFSCGAVDNLWVCLICGHVGCGRYDEKHAYEHYEKTQHCFAMDIESQRVWDYASDQYVHRIVQNKSDGKLVELPSGRFDENTEALYDKLDNIGMEYTYLLTSQLESQRIYFEDQVLTAVDKAKDANQRAEQASERLDAALQAIEDLKLRLSEMSVDVVPSLEKSKDRAERKAEKATELFRTVDKSWKEEKAVSEGLFEKVETLRKETDELKQENADLKDQIRDLMFFVEGRDKLKEMNEDGIEEGAITVADAPEDKKRRKGKGKSKR